MKPGFIPQPQAISDGGVVAGVERQVVQIDRLEDDAVLGIEAAHALHEKRTEAREKVAGNHDAWAGQRGPASAAERPAGRRTRAAVLLEAGERCGLGQEPFARALEPFQAARGADDVEHLLDLDKEVGHHEWPADMCFADGEPGRIRSSRSAPPG